MLVIELINGNYVCFAGSPADKDNLEVGDEILEVNGKTLEDATHTEVINHIHQVNTKETMFYFVFFSWKFISILA